MSCPFILITVTESIQWFMPPSLTEEKLQ